MRRTGLLVVFVVMLAACGASGSDAKAGSTSAPSLSTTTTDAPTTTTTEAPTTTTTIPEARVRQQVLRTIDIACGEAVFYDKPRADASGWDQDWSSVIKYSEFTSQLQSCVDKGIAKKEADRIAAEEAEIAAAGPVNVDEVIKNPEAVKGQVFVLFAEITQFDAATGVCSFRGYWDSRQQEYNYEYGGDNAFFNAGDGISTCPVLDGIDQSDVVRLVVRGAGSFSYDTQSGGNTTAPSFDVLRAEVIEKR